MHLLTTGTAFSLNKKRNHVPRNVIVRTLCALLLYGTWVFASFQHPAGRPIYLSNYAKHTKHHNICNIRGERRSIFLTADLGENKNHSGLMLGLSKREVVTKTRALLPLPQILRSGTKSSSQTWPKKRTVFCCTQFFRMLMTYALKNYNKNALSQS